MLWMPMPVTICWSLKERRSFLHSGAEVDLRRPSRMMAALRDSEMKFVIMKERSVPAPATPASVGVVAGMTAQLDVLLLAMVVV